MAWEWEIEEAGRRKDVYELQRLSYVHEGEGDKLRAIGSALEHVVSQLDPKKNSYELAYVTRALDCPELDAARAHARAALGWPPEMHKVRPAAGTGAEREPPKKPVSPEFYRPRNLWLRWALLLLRAVWIVLVAAGLLILIAMELGADFPGKVWMWLLIGIGCPLVGVLLLAGLEMTLREIIAIREGAYHPEDPSQAKTQSGPQQAHPPVDDGLLGAVEGGVLDVIGGEVGDSHWGEELDWDPGDYTSGTHGSAGDHGWGHSWDHDSDGDGDGD